MPYADDGDIIRGHGCVVIGLAWLEHRVGERLLQAAALLPKPRRDRLDHILLRWPFADKVCLLRDVLERASDADSPSTPYPEELCLAVEALDCCLYAAKERNDALHSPDHRGLEDRRGDAQVFSGWRSCHRLR